MLQLRPNRGPGVRSGIGDNAAAAVVRSIHERRSRTQSQTAARLTERCKVGFPHPALSTLPVAQVKKLPVAGTYLPAFFSRLHKPQIE